MRALVLIGAVLAAALMPGFAQAQPAQYQELVTTHAKANEIPVALVHRVIMRESKYQPRLISRGNIGMMQIKLGTARELGYTGTTDGLLDPNTNLTYAVKYLAGAYRLARGNHDRAVHYYAAGYYYAAKRERQLGALAFLIPLPRSRPMEADADVDLVSEPDTPFSIFKLFEQASAPSVGNVSAPAR